MMDMLPIPYGKQEITEEDQSAVLRALTSDYLTQGPEIARFEASFQSYITCSHAIALSNGTAALHIGAKVLGVSKGTKVVSSPLTFAASTNSILYNEGEVVLCDVDPEIGLIDPYQLTSLLDSDPTIAGIIPVDYAGYPIDTELFRKIIGQGRWMLEDACHAPGAWLQDSTGQPIMCGSNKYADAAIFSFHPVKHIAAGEGGMLTVANVELASRAQMLRTHGITKDAEQLTENHGGWYYEMQELGLNYRLTDLQAALGSSQLSRADQNLSRREQIADRYDEALADLPITLPSRPKNGRHAFHLYVIKTDRRKQLYNYLRQKQVFAQVHYVPVHLHPYYKSLGFKKGQFPNAEKFYEECLSIPMYPSLTEDQQDYVIEQVSAFFNG